MSKLDPRRPRACELESKAHVKVFNIVWVPFGFQALGSRQVGACLFRVQAQVLASCALT